MESETWTDGPNLPFPISSARTIQTQDSFLLVGGINKDTLEYLDTIIEFDPVNVSWIVRNETLATARDAFYMVEVDRERFCD